MRLTAVLFLSVAAAPSVLGAPGRVSPAPTAAAVLRAEAQHTTGTRTPIDPFCAFSLTGISCPPNPEDMTTTTSDTKDPLDFGPWHITDSGMSHLFSISLPIPGSSTVINGTLTSTYWPPGFTPPPNFTHSFWLKSTTWTSEESSSSVSSSSSSSLSVDLITPPPAPSTTSNPDAEAAKETATTTAVEPYYVFQLPDGADADDEENKDKGGGGKVKDDKDFDGNLDQGAQLGQLGCRNGTFHDGISRLNCTDFSVTFGLHRRREVIVRAFNFILQDRVKCSGDRWKSIKSPLPSTIELHAGLRCNSMDPDAWEETYIAYSHSDINVDVDPNCAEISGTDAKRCVLEQRPPAPPEFR